MGKKQAMGVEPNPVQANRSRVRVFCLVFTVAAALAAPPVGCAKDDIASQEQFKALTAELERLDESALKANGSGDTSAERKWDEVFAQLRTLYQDKVESVLIPALHEPDSYCRSCAVVLLGDAGDKRAVEPLIAMLNNKDCPDRYYVALALGRIGDRRAVPPLIKALEDKDCGLRWQVEEALGHLRDPQAVKPLIKVLKARKDLGTCYGGAPRLIIVARKPYEKGDDPPPAWALVQIGAPAVKDLAEAASDPACPDRQVFVKTLGRIGAPAVESLIFLRKDSHAGFLASVVEALGETRDERAVEAITESLKDPDEHVRKEASLALKKIQDRSTGPLKRSDRDRPK
jgi:HEAT repeat protein